MISGQENSSGMVISFVFPHPFISCKDQQGGFGTGCLTPNLSTIKAHTYPSKPALPCSSHFYVLPNLPVTVTCQVRCNGDYILFLKG